MQTTLRPQAELTTCQTSALDKLEREGNIFLTGAAGTGKSFLLDQYLRDKSSLSFPIVASTGAAAVIIGGRTFHSFFGLGIMEGGLHAAVLRASKNKRLITLLLSAQCVIIDEISMLSGTTLYAAEQIARRVRGRDEPWGGLRIIAVGDFAQLPPVTPAGQQKDWAFMHDVWRTSDFHPALLSTVMRTQESEFLTILNHVRKGEVNDHVRDFLNRHMDATEEQEEGTRLYAHRAKAEEYNLRRLDSLTARLHSFRTVYEGNEQYLENAKRAMPIPDELHLKENSLVMMRKNDVSFGRLYVNGSLGHVVQIDDEELHIRLLTGETIQVQREKFSYLDGDGRELLGAWNFPVTLAWATTIHKAQGASLDRMTVDLSSLWEPGQAYVALSRVRGASGLSIERWSPNGIRAEPLVTQLYDVLSEASKQYVPRPFFTVKEISRAESDGDEESHAPARKGFGSKAKRTGQIKTLIKKQTPLKEMADAVGVKVERVILYIEEFLKAGDSVSVSYLLDGIQEADRIRRAFEEHGVERLKPAFDSLNEEFSFTELRVVRCVMMAEEGI